MLDICPFCECKECRPRLIVCVLIEASLGRFAGNPPSYIPKFGHKLAQTVQTCEWTPPHSWRNWCGGQSCLQSDQGSSSELLLHGGHPWRQWAYHQCTEAQHKAIQYWLDEIGSQSWTWSGTEVFLQPVERAKVIRDHLGVTYAYRLSMVQGYHLQEPLTWRRSE